MTITPNTENLDTGKMSVLLVYCGPHLPLAPGPHSNWKASESFPYVWFCRRRRPRDAVQVAIFVGGPLLETIAPYGRRPLWEKARVGPFLESRPRRDDAGDTGANL